MTKIFFTKSFKKDFKNLNPLELISSAGWIETMYCLANAKPLSAARKDHPLQGKWKGCRDCHIKGDLVLIYEYKNEEIILHRIGSHAELGIMKEGKH